MARAARMAVPGADFLLSRAQEELADRLAVTNRGFSDALVLGPEAQRVAGTLMETGKVSAARPVATDKEEVIDAQPASADLFVSLMHLHQLDDVPGALIQMRRALKPDGLLLACVPAAGTLQELREALLAAETQISGGAHARVMPFMDVRDAGALLQRAGLALPVADGDEVTVRYATVFDLMRDLRAMGATNVLADRPRRFSSRKLFFDAAEHYALRHADPDGRIRATYAFVWMSGWAPAENQPQPLKPGSATQSLAEALRDRSGKA